MQDLNITPFSSLEDLFKKLEKKYSGKDEAFHFKVPRYPASLIFFDSKWQYKKFLEEVPFERRPLSASIEDPNKISCYKMRKWLKTQFKDAKECPLVIYPMTEYLRICAGKNSRKMIESLFGQIVQAEGSSLIVPMLDYSNNYLQFIHSFVHHERMAEVYSCSSQSEEDDAAIELILDKTGRVVDDRATVITSARDWLSLWETGDIASQKMIIVTDDRLIDAIKVSHFSVPKVEKIPIENEKDYLARFYQIDPSSFVLEPSEQIWDYIFQSLSSGGHKKTWGEIVTETLGSTDDLEKILPSLWEESSHDNLHRQIQRWFWLNEAKKQHFESEILENIIPEETDPERFLDRAYLMALSDTEVDDRILEERRTLFKRFNAPLFHSGTITFEQAFQNWAEDHTGDPQEAILHLTGLYDFEKQYLLKAVIDLFQKDIPISTDLFHIIQECWPAYAAYIEPLLSSQPQSLSPIHENVPLFADTYRRAYIASKLIDDKPNDLLCSLQKDYHTQWIDLKGAQSIGKVLSHNRESFQECLKATGYLFLDGVGYEWAHVLQSLFEERGWGVAQIHPLIAPLPSDTEHSPLPQSTKIYREFDTRLHQRYKYPDSIYEEIKILENVTDDIHQRYKSRKSPIWIVSDHGATAFARKGRALNLKDITKEHGGRYGICTSSKRLDNESIYCTSDGKHNLAVSLTYDNLGDTCPQGEAHGGGVPEEVLACALLLYPPEVTESEEEIKIAPTKSEFEALEEDVTIQLRGMYDTEILTIEVSVNKGARFSLRGHIKNGVISIPLSILKQNGFSVGENTLEIILNHSQKASCVVSLTSGSSDTGFDDLFDL